MNLRECRERRALQAGMYPGDLLSVIRQFKHPLWYTFGVETNRWGARQRESVGLFDAHGTLWFATANAVMDDFSGRFAEEIEGERPRKRVAFGPVPCDEIPFKSVNTARREEGTILFRGGKMLRGWDDLLHKLCTSGFLYPDERLSALLGGDSWKAVPRYLWA